MSGDSTPVRGAAGVRSGNDEAVLADRLRVMVVRLGRELRRQDPGELSITLYSALATLADRGEVAMGELADAERLPSSAATRIADRLQEAGYLVRRPNPADRRGVLLGITAAGRRLVAERRKRGNAWLAGRLAGLSAAERRALGEALGVLDAVLAGEDESLTAESLTAGSLTAVEGAIR